MNEPKIKVFVEGRYKKLTRDLPQTVFFCPECKGHPRRRKKCERCEGFGKLTRDSVQELVGWVLGAALKTRKNKFHGAGREDIDVRMLGTGRPFVMEFIGPKEPDIDLAAVETEINRRNEGRLEILGLHWTQKERVRVLKEGKNAKHYGARISVAGVLDLERAREQIGQRVQLAQRTPDRVAHRRADLERSRWLELTSLEPVGDSDSPTACDIELLAQHGTYVKEAIGGEHGRTKPSLSELLGVECACEALDVLGILDEEGKGALETTARAATFGENVS